MQFNMIDVLKLSGFDLHELAFLLGYHQVEIPRLLRKVFAKTGFHRSWLKGYSGSALCSVLDRT